MAFFIIVYQVGIQVEMSIRAPLRKTWKAAAKKKCVSREEKFLLGMLWVVMIVFPLICSVTDGLDLADYSLLLWMVGWGVVLMACALLVFTRAHADLKSNGSPTLEVFEGPILVTKGICCSLSPSTSCACALRRR